MWLGFRGFIYASTWDPHCSISRRVFKFFAWAARRVLWARPPVFRVSRARAGILSDSTGRQESFSAFLTVFMFPVGFQEPTGILGLISVGFNQPIGVTEITDGLKETDTKNKN